MGRLSCALVLLWSRTPVKMTYFPEIQLSPSGLIVWAVTVRGWGVFAWGVRDEDGRDLNILTQELFPPFRTTYKPVFWIYQKAALLWLLWGFQAWNHLHCGVWAGWELTEKMWKMKEKLHKVQWKTLVLIIIVMFIDLKIHSTCINRIFYNEYKEIFVVFVVQTSWRVQPACPNAERHREALELRRGTIFCLLGEDFTFTPFMKL